MGFKMSVRVWSSGDGGVQVKLMMELKDIPYVTNYMLGPCLKGCLERLPALEVMCC